MAGVSHARIVAPMLLLFGCAAKHERVSQAVPPPPVAAPTMPDGAFTGMVVPAARVDGSYPTPSDGLSNPAAAWHLRAALNVAALVCRGPENAGIADAYNALLASRKVELAAAERALAAEYRRRGGYWQDEYDDAMTRLYNYYAQAFAKPGFCRAAQASLTRIAAAPATPLAGSAQVELASVDRPFVDFYRAYDAWRLGNALTPVRPSLPAPVIAAAAAPAVVQAVPRAVPYLRVDVAALPDS